MAAGAYTAVEQPLGDFVVDVERCGSDKFARDVIEHQQPTSPRGPRKITKAEAALRYARILTDHQIERLPDVTALLSIADSDRLVTVETDLATVPGHGGGIRISYLWMLAGDDQHIKADRMVRRWLSRALGRHEVSVREATELVSAAAGHLNATPWMLDHAIWKSERWR